jgi:hypothetical protein
MSADEPSPIKIWLIELNSEAQVAQVLHELRGGAPGFYIGKIENMGDLNYGSGPGAAVGSHAQVSQNIDDVDLIKLAVQLEIVRIEMARLMGSSRTVEQDDEIGHIAGATIAAQKGDRKGVIAHLKQVGAWTLKVAKETGSEIVALTLAHLVAH